MNIHQKHEIQIYNVRGNLALSYNLKNTKVPFLNYFIDSNMKDNFLYLKLLMLYHEIGNETCFESFSFVTNFFFVLRNLFRKLHFYFIIMSL